MTQRAARRTLLFAVLVIGCGTSSSPEDCRVARVGAIEVVEADVTRLGEHFRPSPPRAEAERLLVEAAACVAPDPQASARLPFAEAMECHKQFLILLQFLWNVNTVSANKISFDGIEGIHKEACPNGNCANQTITWSILRQGAQDYYGGNTSNPQYVHFRDRGDEFGVDEDL